MRIAVIGGGLFGCTAAIHAARAEHEVHLFERSGAIMQAASAVNQFRLHQGYHYPRSMETGRECRRGNYSFAAEYGEAVITPDKRRFRGGQFYAIAKEGSKVSADEYIRFLDASKLTYRIVPKIVPGIAMVDPESVDLAIEAKECTIDPVALQRLVEERLGRYGVHVHLNACLTARDAFDQIIICTYAHTNVVAHALGCRTIPLQFEVCEKPVLRLPDTYRHVGCVVMDGPFCSLDPYGKTGLHVMGHVVHAIHETSIGDDPPALPKRKETKVKEMLEAGSQFFPALKNAEHVRSMYTVRAVLPNKDATDERPTIVERLDDQVIRIFSGKLGTAVDAAQEAVFMLERQRVAA